MRKYNVVTTFTDGTKSSVFVFGHTMREAKIWAAEKCKSGLKADSIEFTIIKREYGNKWVSEEYYKKLNIATAKYYAK